MLRHIDAGVLNVAHLDEGSPDGWPVLLLHGFPFDIHSYDEVTPRLTHAGARVVTPYLRGFGPTRFLSPSTLRSGQQAAIGQDVVALLDALQIPSALLAGYDWGSTAACVAAALWPDRVSGLVSANGYKIQDIAGARQPAEPENEHRFWYQHYFQGERGRAGLESNRYSFCRLLWRLWSPTWNFDDATYDLSAAAFENPDFVDVVIHSYRHRFGLVEGDPALEELERRLAAQPPIAVSTNTIDGAADGVMPRAGSAHHSAHFSGWRQHRVFQNVGHNLPQEAPGEFAAAVLALQERTSGASN
jgi:pimeloyl-ACP methyl ester carboxylesterase